MLPRLRRDRPAGILLRSTAIALIAMVMPFGLDISGDGDVSFGAPVAHAKVGGDSDGDSGGNGGDAGGDTGGDNGHGNGGEESQGEDPDSDSDPSNPGRNDKDDVGSGDDSETGESGSDDDSLSGVGSNDSSADVGDNDSSGGAGSSSSQDSGRISGALGSFALASDYWFNGSAEPAGPDLTQREEQDLISRGWQ